MYSLDPGIDLLKLWSSKAEVWNMDCKALFKMEPQNCQYISIARKRIFGQANSLPLGPGYPQFRAPPSEARIPTLSTVFHKLISQHVDGSPKYLRCVLNSLTTCIDILLPASIKCLSLNVKRKTCQISLNGLVTKIKNHYLFKSTR